MFRTSRHSEAAPPKRRWLEKANSDVTFLLVFFSFPNVVWTLSPAVHATLVDAILAFQAVKLSTPTHL